MSRCVRQRSPTFPRLEDASSPRRDSRPLSALNGRKISPRNSVCYRPFTSLASAYPSFGQSRGVFVYIVRPERAISPATPARIPRAGSRDGARRIRIAQSNAGPKCPDEKFDRILILSASRLEPLETLPAGRQVVFFFSQRAAREQRKKSRTKSALITRLGNGGWTRLIDPSATLREERYCAPKKSQLLIRASLVIRLQIRQM